MMDVLEEALKTIRSIYPQATVKEIKAGRRKIRVYGQAEGIWFKITIDTLERRLRVYSNSKTIERMVRKKWRELSFEKKERL